MAEVMTLTTDNFDANMEVEYNCETQSYLNKYVFALLTQLNERLVSFEDDYATALKLLGGAE
jgi:hypothetical protein